MRWQRKRAACFGAEGPSRSGVVRSLARHSELRDRAVGCTGAADPIVGLGRRNSCAQSLIFLSIFAATLTTDLPAVAASCHTLGMQRRLRFLVSSPDRKPTSAWASCGLPIRTNRILTRQASFAFSLSTPWLGCLPTPSKLPLASTLRPPLRPRPPIAGCLALVLPKESKAS